jgi:hypothetical protein
MAISEAPPNLKLLLIGNSSYVSSLLTWSRMVLIGRLQGWKVVAINALYGCTVPTRGESAVMLVWIHSNVCRTNPALLLELISEFASWR